MTSPRTLHFDVVARCAVLVHGEAAPDDAEWSAYVERLAAASFDGILVFTDRASPSAAQRQRLVDRLEAQGRMVTLPTAVLTGSLVSRGVVTALSWFGAQIRAFEPSHLDAALHYLGVAVGEHEEVLRTALRLRLELVGADVASLDRLHPRQELARRFRAFRGRHAPR